MKTGSFTRLTFQMICLLSILSFFVPSCRTNDQSSGATKIRISPRLPENEIRDELLTFTPIGSTSEEVKGFAQSRLRHAGSAPYDVGEEPGFRGIGVSLGRYGCLTRTDTYIVWIFDKNDKLTDVIVAKEHDSL